MKTWKIALGLASAAALSLCSFAVLNHNPDELPVDKQLFEKFVGEFPKVELPYTVQMARPENEAQAEALFGWEARNNSDVSEGKRLAYEYAKFIPALERGYMSRMGPDDFFPDALITQNETFTAVIYKRRPSFQARASSYILATYDKTGKLIGQRTVGSCYADYMETPTIGKDLKISVAHYKANYKDDAAKTIEYTVEKTEQMHIDEKGAIVFAGANTVTPGQKQDLRKVVSQEVWNN